MKLVCVLTTFPNLALARKFSRDLLQNKLAACIQIIPKVESHYAWKGKLEKSREILLLIKTQADLFKRLETFFKKNHPYEIPELIQIPISKSAHAYLKWIQSVTDKV